ncbi:MAG: 50S ribosomal protein L23 [Candidatus Binatia bacterium]|nr:MAG: 50S ribosomal protein L23 [Candidatus Binatia bacterium]
MMEPTDVIRSALVTEKGTLLQQLGNQYVFAVHPKANKFEIRSAVERLFKVKVVNVRTANYLGQVRRVGKGVGRRPNWKKAYVTLAPGHRIELFDVG